MTIQPTSTNHTPAWVRAVAAVKVVALAVLAVVFFVLNHLSAPSLALAATPTSAVQQTVQQTVQHKAGEGLRCAGFLIHREAAWYKAQQWQNKTYRVGGPLDSDLDGYACESLVKYTAAVNEPDCYRPVLKPWTKDCSARTQYRTITHLTSHEDAYAIRAALLDVYAPYAANGATSAVVKTALAEALGCASVGSITEMQRFIRTEHTRNKLVQAFAGMLGLGDKVLGRMPLTKDYYKAIDAYLDAATGVAEWGSAIQLSDTARTKLVASYTDGPCQG